VRGCHTGDRSLTSQNKKSRHGGIPKGYRAMPAYSSTNRPDQAELFFIKSSVSDSVE